MTWQNRVAFVLHLFWVVAAYFNKTCEGWYSCVVYIWQIRVGSRRQQTHQCNRKLAGWFAVFCYNKVLFVPWSAFQTSRSGVNKNRHQTCTWLNGAGFPIALCFQTETQISFRLCVVCNFVNSVTFRIQPVGVRRFDELLYLFTREINLSIACSLSLAFVINLDRFLVILLIDGYS